jgi:hypothetical protein
VLIAGYLVTYAERGGPRSLTKPATLTNAHPFVPGLAQPPDAHPCTLALDAL